MRPERQVLAALPVRVREDGLTADLLEGDVLGRMVRSRRDRQSREHRLRIRSGPLQHLHSTHRSADDSEQPVDPEMFNQALLGADHVPNGNRRKFGAPRLVGHCPIRQFAVAERAGAAHAAAEDIRTDDEEAIRIDRQFRTDHRIPPSWFAGDRVLLSDILVQGKRMADQHRIGPIGVQRAIGAVGDGMAPQVRAAFKLDPIVERDMGVAVGFCRVGSCRGLVHRGVA